MGALNCYLHALVLCHSSSLDFYACSNVELDQFSEEQLSVLYICIVMGPLVPTEIGQEVFGKINENNRHLPVVLMALIYM